MIKKVFFFFGIVSPFLPGCYVLKLGYHHAKILNKRQHVEEVIKAPKTHKKTKEQLLTMKKILAFAKKQGLNTERAYKKIIMSTQDSVSHVLQVAHPYELKNVTWWFPIVGTVPYRGYFDQKERDAEAQKWVFDGYDVSTGSVSAFSSLGWFEDPIYSSMLEREEYSLADLLFHELTHRTYWQADDTTFNEHLACFIGEHLTLLYLKEHKEYKQLEDFRRYKSDEKKFNTWLKKLRDELKKLFENREKLGKEHLKREKTRIYNRYTGAEKPHFDKVDFIGRPQIWNNARILASSLYSPNYQIFSRGYNCSQAKTVGDFLEKLKQQTEKTSRGYKALEKLCQTR